MTGTESSASRNSARLVPSSPTEDGKNLLNMVPLPRDLQTLKPIHLGTGNSWKMGPREDGWLSGCARHYLKHLLDINQFNSHHNPGR